MIDHIIFFSILWMSFQPDCLTLVLRWRLILKIFHNNFSFIYSGLSTDLRFYEHLNNIVPAERMLSASKQWCIEHNELDLAVPNLPLCQHHVQQTCYLGRAAEIVHERRNVTTQHSVTHWSESAPTWMWVPPPITCSNPTCYYCANHDCMPKWGQG